MTNLNDTVQQSDIVSIVGSCEERCDPVSDLLCHTLRTHAVVLQEHLDATYKPAINRGTTVEARISVGRYSSCYNKYRLWAVYVKDISFLLSVVEQVEAERIGWG